MKRAWGVKTIGGRLLQFAEKTRATIALGRSLDCNDRIIPVLITELPPRPAKKKGKRA